MLVELLRPGGSDLSRRWLAALLLVDEADRPALVAEVERRAADAYAKRRADPRRDDSAEVHVVHPPVQREGYVEQTIATYASTAPHPAAPVKAKRAAK